ncbi:MAG TPA: phage holin family protein [Vicinamibacterales bacterium]|nr:phage holin family protein [Vicinamibacterales bacterium]HEX2462341.1 phage holin family protein [Vicinamibacterales bacterium]
MRILLSILLNALAIYVAAYLLDGIVLSGTAAALIAGLVLGIVNTFVKPVLILLTLPITLVTLGLFLFVVNAICLALTAWVVPGFEIAGFWSAVGGALIVSLVGWAVGGLREDRRGHRGV